MKNLFKKNTSELSTQEQLKFNEYFPNAKIATMPLNQIPENVLIFFEKRSGMFIDVEDYKPENFDKLFVILHNNGNKTYIVEQSKTYATNKNTEELIYVADINNDGEITGYGEIRKNLNNQNDYFKNKPFVGYTRTNEKFQKQGLGIQRLFIMNALTQMSYGLPLNSDTLIQKEAKSLWEKIVQKGFAKKYKEGIHDRYVFLDKFNQIK